MWCDKKKGYTKLYCLNRESMIIHYDWYWTDILCYYPIFTFQMKSTKNETFWFPFLLSVNSVPISSIQYVLYSEDGWPPLIVMIIVFPPSPDPAHPQAPVVSSLHVLPLPHPQWNAPGLRAGPATHLSPEHLHQGPAGAGDGVTLHRALPQLWEHLQGEHSVWPVTRSPTSEPLAHACGGVSAAPDTFSRYNFIPTLSSMHHRS